MIKSELDTVWITSDGSKFLTQKEAEIHETINNVKEKPKWLEKLQQKLK